MNRFIVCTAFCLLASSAPAAELPDTVFIEELTWTEVRDAIKAGKTTVIFPTGGTEQNGAHMVLGKHNFIVKHAAEQIARRLGNALVAPVLAYVPEGSIDPPSGHVRYSGTISLPDDVFTKVTEYAARSFRASGFKHIVLIGDSGGNQKAVQAVASSLNKQWMKSNGAPPAASRVMSMPLSVYGVWQAMQWPSGPARYAPYLTLSVRGGATTFCLIGRPYARGSLM